MSIFKRGNVYWYHFLFNGEHIPEKYETGKSFARRAQDGSQRTCVQRGQRVRLASPNGSPSRLWRTTSKTVSRLGRVRPSSKRLRRRGRDGIARNWRTSPAMARW